MIWQYVVGFIIVLVGFSAFFGAPYVPSRRKDVVRMFNELYPLGVSDVLIDIGSGDGVILREASRRGARAIGYEIHPLLVVISKLASLHDRQVSVTMANFWSADFPANATIIYAFSVGRDSKKMERKIQAESTRLQKPLTLVCYGSPLPNLVALRQFEAYHLYEFYPLQVSVA
jgi:hypothetical protein